MNQFLASPSVRVARSLLLALFGLLMVNACQPEVPRYNPQRDLEIGQAMAAHLAEVGEGRRVLVFGLDNVLVHEATLDGFLREASARGLEIVEILPGEFVEDVEGEIYQQTGVADFVIQESLQELDGVEVVVALSGIFDDGWHLLDDGWQPDVPVFILDSSLLKDWRPFLQSGQLTGVAVPRDLVVEEVDSPNRIIVFHRGNVDQAANLF